jgi:hypothetical protein
MNDHLIRQFTNSFAISIEQSCKLPLVVIALMILIHNKIYITCVTLINCRFRQKLQCYNFSKLIAISVESGGCVSVGRTGSCFCKGENSCIFNGNNGSFKRGCVVDG